MPTCRGLEYGEFEGEGGKNNGEGGERHTGSWEGSYGTRSTVRKGRNKGGKEDVRMKIVQAQAKKKRKKDRFPQRGLWSEE